MAGYHPKNTPVTVQTANDRMTLQGWIGNLKEVKYRLLMEQKPEFAMELAVKGMLPKNSIGRNSLKRLKLYKGAEHNNAAQKPDRKSVV